MSENHRLSRLPHRVARDSVASLFTLEGKTHPGSGHRGCILDTGNIGQPGWRARDRPFQSSDRMIATPRRHLRDRRLPYARPRASLDPHGMLVKSWHAGPWRGPVPPPHRTPSTLMASSLRRPGDNRMPDIVAGRRPTIGMWTGDGGRTTSPGARRQLYIASRKTTASLRKSGVRDANGRFSSSSTAAMTTASASTPRWRHLRRIEPRNARGKFVRTG